MNTHRKVTPTREPVITTASITAAVSALIALLVAFGVDLSEEQTTAILGVVAVVAPLVVIIARRYVTPSSDVVERRDGPHVVAGAGHDALADGEVVRDVHDA